MHSHGPWKEFQQNFTAGLRGFALVDPRAPAKTRGKSCFFFFVSLLAISCGTDEGSRAKTMTTNALSNLQWNQELRHTIPVGIDVDSATSILRNDGFICVSSIADKLVGCQKIDGVPLISERHLWRAEIWIKKSKVVSVRGFYQIAGP